MLLAEIVMLLKFNNNSSPFSISSVMGAFYLFIANFFATQIIGGTKELVVLL